MHQKYCDHGKIQGMGFGQSASKSLDCVEMGPRDSSSVEPKTQCCDTENSGKRCMSTSCKFNFHWWQATIRRWQAMRKMSLYRLESQRREECRLAVRHSSLDIKHLQTVSIHTILLHASGDPGSTYYIWGLYQRCLARYAGANKAYAQG